MTRLPSGQIVYDPRGTVTTEPTDLAARLPRFEGVRLGVLDNSKWNARRLLDGIIALLREKHHLLEHEKVEIVDHQDGIIIRHRPSKMRGMLKGVFDLETLESEIREVRSQWRADES